MYRNPRTKTILLIALATVLVAVASLAPLRLWARERPQRSGGESVGQLVQAAESGTPGLAEQRVLISRYCLGCHNSRNKSGGLALDTLDLAAVGVHPEVWERVARKLRGGVMPPPGRPRPEPAAYSSLVGWLEAELDRAAADAPNPGRTESLHRLNRAEYKNAIRDLFSLDIEIDELPGDDASYGFDNVAAALRVNPSVIEKYINAARKVSRLAVGVTPPPVAAETFRVPAGLSQSDRLDGLPLGTRGGTVVRYNFPVDAEYVLRVAYSAVPAGKVSQEIEVSIDGERVGLSALSRRRPEAQVVAADPKAAGAAQAPGYAKVTPGYELRIPVKAGPRVVVATFIRTPPMAIDGQLRTPFKRPRGGEAEGAGSPEPRLQSLTISGPFNVTGPGDTPSRQRIFVCRPTGSSDEDACARKIMSTLARRAYRRSPTADDLQVLLEFYRQGHSRGSFDEGIEAAVNRLLASPQFLFRFEQEPSNSRPAATYRIADNELASRLSFFLWSSIPDDELLDVAAHGQLHKPVVLAQQVRRMLADRRSDALVTNFAGQWLQLRNIDAATPDEFLFPDFDEGLRYALKRETELFFQSILRENRSVREFLTADYTFVNERLARHYGIPDVYGPRFRKVSLAGNPRRGILGQGSVLLVTSRPNRTSPVLRGKWIMENVLGTPPPEPPPNVPALTEKKGAETALTMRERMAEHRANPVCASCHATIDPLGFALERFDAVGRWRDVDAGFKPVDDSGTMPDGKKFKDGIEFREALLANFEPFVMTLTERLLTYAVGRGLDYYDRPALRQIVREAGADGFTMESLVIAIVNSIPFQMRQATPVIKAAAISAPTIPTIRRPANVHQ